MKNLILLALLVTTYTYAAKPSKCVVKIQYSVYEDGNQQYKWCLGDWDEDGDGYFLKTRRFVRHGLLKSECEDFANAQIGDIHNFRFMESMTVPGAPILQYECEGVAEEVSKIRYRSAKK
jgi:hypothetical protein